MFTFDPDQRYLMPGHFGPRPRGKGKGYYHDVTTMNISYFTDRQKLAAHLPEPFEVGEEPVLSVIYLMNREIDWLAGHSYNLIAVNASVVFNGEVDQLAGFYTLVMWENLTDPILTGREIQGIPKIYADIPDHSMSGGIWRATAGHFSHKIVDLTIKDASIPKTEEVEKWQKEMKGKDNWMGWRYFPKVGGVGTSMSEPTLFPIENNVREAWVGQGEVVWQHLTWEQNPTQFHIVNALAALPNLEYRQAVVTKGSMNLVVPDQPPRVLR
jgi:acetoacetate decarboxylase